MNPEDNLNLILKLIIKWLENVRQSYHCRVIQKPVVVSSLPFSHEDKTNTFEQACIATSYKGLLLGWAEERGWE